MTANSKADGHAISGVFSDVLVGVGLFLIALFIASSVPDDKFWIVLSVGIVGALGFFGSAGYSLWRASRAVPVPLDR